MPVSDTLHRHRSTPGQGRRRPRSMLLVALLAGLAASLAAPLNATAHRGDQSYLYLDVGSELRARLQMPIIDMEEAFGIDFGDTEASILDAVDANAAFLEDYALDHVAIGAPGTPWTLTPAGFDLVGTIYVEVILDVDHGSTLPDEIVVTLDPFFDEIDDRDALLLIANDWKRGIVDNEASSLQRFTPGARTHLVEFGGASQWKNLTSSVELGIDHIRSGPDHILFIIALLLPSVLVWRQLWLPTDRFGSSLWRITKIMTMFTLAHSITFTLTGLDLVPAPGARLTETVIALSIAATALHNLRPIVFNREWLIALVFGLFHGFGFASLVQGLEVDTTTELVSLAGRNIGIEIGQIAIVLMVFPALFLLRRTRFYRPVFVGGSVVLIMISLGWAFERTIGDGTGATTTLMNRVFDYPRVLGLILIFGLLACAAHLWERAQDRLLPTVADEAADPDAERERQLVRP